MEILCLGLSHHTAPVELREKFAIPDAEVAAIAAKLRTSPGVQEAVIVSTCNRVEFYIAADQAVQGFAAVDEVISSRGTAPDAEGFRRMTTAATIRHLFRVACGLDSMVLGETEILGQVKKAYAAASEAGATSKYLNKLFQRTFNVAKEVRTKTNITRGSVSVGSVAVDLAERCFGRLKNCHVMILGAGEMSELIAGALAARGVHSIFVANRSYDRAVALAEKMKGKAVHFDEWPREIREVDILIGSTAAPHYVLTAAQLEPIMRTRRDRTLFCIDLAVPRDIEPAVNDIEGVYRYDINDLQTYADQSMDIRKQELVVCEQMIERHVLEFSEWLAGGWTQAGVRYSEAVSGGQS
jgi:glutamyl-tRNA reductase